MEIEETEPEWARCVSTVLHLVPSPGLDTRMYLRASVPYDLELVKYLAAISYVESRGQIGAVSHAGALGLMQLLWPAVVDGAGYCGIRVPGLMQLHSPAISLRYAACYLRMLRSDLGDWTRVLIVYNGGFSSLTRYDKGATVPSETSNYVLQVQRIFNMCGS